MFVVKQKYKVKKVFNVSVCIVCLLFAAIACKEDPGLIGLDVQPEDEILNTDHFDSTTVEAYSAVHDSLITSNVSVNMLGYMNDPVFGETQAGIYTQFRLSSFNANFGDNVQVDSLVLTLTYSGYYGDTLNAFRLRAYELTDKLIENTNYYTLSSLNYDNVNLTEDNNLYITPRPNTKQDTSASPYYFRVKLKNDFAKSKFIDAPSSVYANDAAFLDYFKGLYLKADAMTGNGCMISCNMTVSGLTLYYSNSLAKNQQYIYRLNESTLHFGAVDHFNYAGATSHLRDQLNGNHTSASDILYLQAGAGVKVVLGFPYLKSTFNDQQVVIHRASLIINCMEDASSDYPPAGALNLTYTDPLTNLGNLLPDFYLGSDYFGGTYNQTKKEYRFHITQYIQNLVNGRGSNYSVNILINPSATRLSRLMIYGPRPSLAADIDKRLRLEIYYTIINK
ncbi:MAG: DUF4270 domain-containing protein [Bacteroidales bacterium]|jgi:hypothetical protein|nr:DUF4270 domain-containing protein [Bacteroidales bacterium]